MPRLSGQMAIDRAIGFDEQASASAAAQAVNKKPRRVAGLINTRGPAALFRGHRRLDHAFHVFLRQGHVVVGLGVLDDDRDHFFLVVTAHRE